MNYDNVIEAVARDVGQRAVTCIPQWNRERSIDLPDDGLVLLKLHGSVTWRYVYTAHSHLMTQDICERQDGFPEDTPGQAGQGNCRHDHHNRALIYDPVAKISGEGPFIQLLAAFQTALWQTDRLVVIGYSFRDPHINGVIEDWATRRSRSVRLVNGEGYSESENPWTSNLKERIGERFQNTHKAASAWLRDDLLRF